MNRYQRQTLLSQLGEEGQEKLSNSSITIVGCGALGTFTANALVRVGVGEITLVDRDFTELHNLHRVSILGEEDLGLPKAPAVAERLRKVNSEVAIQTEVVDVNPDNAEKLAEGRNLVLDCTDNLLTRYLINDVCLKKEIPWIYAAVIETYGLIKNIVPSAGPCLRCLFPDQPSIRFLPTCDTAGVISTVPQSISAIQVTEALKLLTGKKFQDNLLFFDIWQPSLDRIKVERDENCPACGKENFEFLEGELRQTTTSLCGRKSVQINDRSREELNLKELAAKLESAGEVKLQKVILHLDIGDYSLHIFQDGRAIIDGTNDENRAKSLYSRYVGN